MCMCSIQVTVRSIFYSIKFSLKHLPYLQIFLGIINTLQMNEHVIEEDY